MCRGWRKEMGGGGLVELWPSKTHGATRAIVIDPVIMGTGGITWPSCWWRNCLGGLMEKRFRGGSILAVITPTLAPVVPGWSTVAVRATSAGTAHSANCLRCFWRHVDRIWSHTNTPNNPQPLATVQRKAQSMDCRLLDLQRKVSGLLKLNRRLAWGKNKMAALCAWKIQTKPAPTEENVFLQTKPRWINTSKYHQTSNGIPRNPVVFLKLRNTGRMDWFLM
jgi:hypothetical protein